MLFVKRGPGGAIEALYAAAQPGAEEAIASDHPDVLAFLGGDGEADGARAVLAESDLQMARVTEDLVELLIEKNLIMFTELPEEAQKKLMKRKALRASASLSLGLVEDGVML